MKKHKNNIDVTPLDPVDPYESFDRVEYVPVKEESAMTVLEVVPVEVDQTRFNAAIKSRVSGLVADINEINNSIVELQKKAGYTLEVELTLAELVEKCEALVTNVNEANTLAQSITR